MRIFSTIDMFLLIIVPSILLLKSPVFAHWETTGVLTSRLLLASVTSGSVLAKP